MLDRIAFLTEVVICSASWATHLGNRSDQILIEPSTAYAVDSTGCSFGDLPIEVNFPLQVPFFRNGKLKVMVRSIVLKRWLNPMGIEERHRPLKRTAVIIRAANVELHNKPLGSVLGNS